MHYQRIGLYLHKMSFDSSRWIHTGKLRFAYRSKHHTSLSFTRTRQTACHSPRQGVFQTNIRCSTCVHYRGIGLTLKPDLISSFNLFFLVVIVVFVVFLLDFLFSSCDSSSFLFPVYRYMIHWWSVGGLFTMD